MQVRYCHKVLPVPPYLMNRMELKQIPTQNIDINSTTFPSLASPYFRYSSQRLSKYDG